MSFILGRGVGGRWSSWQKCEWNIELYNIHILRNILKRVFKVLGWIADPSLKALILSFCIFVYNYVFMLINIYLSVDITIEFLYLCKPKVIMI